MSYDRMLVRLARLVKAMPQESFDPLEDYNKNQMEAFRKSAPAPWEKQLEEMNEQEFLAWHLRSQHPNTDQDPADSWKGPQEDLSSYLNSAREGNPDLKRYLQGLTTLSQDPDAIAQRITADIIAHAKKEEDLTDGYFLFDDFVMTLINLEDIEGAAEKIWGPGRIDPVEDFPPDIDYAEYEHEGKSVKTHAPEHYFWYAVRNALYKHVPDNMQSMT